METIETQMQLISRGTERITDAQELSQKIAQAIEKSKPLKIKLGVDPTAPDIHLGHTVPLRKLRHFQQLGHEVIFLIGDFTGRIGDPTGRDKTRPPLTEEQILANAQTYLEQVAKVLDTNKLRVVYNSHWLKDLTFGELIKMAATTTMSKMLEHNTFRQRLESSESIRIHELLYPFMQGFDSVVLEADVELGGSDQTFNLTFGRDLQRFFGQEAQICITMPILTGIDGVQKMSKSLSNYIGINEPPAIMFHKIMRMVDSNLVNYFTLLTDVSESEIKIISTQLQNEPTTDFIIDCKKKLAFEIIKTYHSEAIAQEVTEAHGKLDKGGLSELSINDLVSEMGAVNLPLMMKEKLGLSSLNEAKRLIKQGAVSVNGQKVAAETQEMLLDSGDIFKFGKTKIVKILK